MNLNLNILRNLLPTGNTHTDPAPPASADTYARLLDETKHLVRLEVENARLLLTEKLSLLFARIALAAVCFVISACAVIFLSMSAADFLLQSLAPWATYLIVAGFYILLIIILALTRRKLITDPIARYLSKIILDPKPAKPNPTTNEDEGK